MRVGYLADESMGRVEPGIWSKYLAAVEKLRQSGAEMAPVSLPGFDDCPFIAMTIAYAEIASLHHELLRTKAALYDQAIRGLICLGEIWSSRHYLDAQRLRSVFRQRFANIQAPFDAILTPSVAIQPPKIGVPAHVTGDPPAQGLYTVMRFTVLFNCHRTSRDFGSLGTGRRRSADRRSAHRASWSRRPTSGARSTSRRRARHDAGASAGKEALGAA